MPNFKKRDNTEEILDDFDLSGHALEQNLGEIELINKWLGGQSLVLDGLRQIFRVKGLGSNQTVKIADIGCGSGDVLRKVHDWGIKNEYSLQLEGIDANPNILDYARIKLENRKNIEFQELNVIDSVLDKEYDVILMNLFLHHFTDDEIEVLITRLLKQTKTAILINDLHRHPLAYYAFNSVSSLFGFSQISKNDGSLSVLKAFTSDELERIGSRHAPHNFSLKWKWAFRYQLIMYTD